MMKNLRRVATVLAFAALWAGSHAAAFAEDQVSESRGVDVTVTGLNLCLAAALGTAGDPDVVCSAAECRHVLKVSTAQGSNGNPLEGAETWTLHYLYSKTSAPLSNEEKYRDQEVTIAGTLFEQERALKVRCVELTGGGDEEEDFFDYDEGYGSASGQTPFDFDEE